MGKKSIPKKKKKLSKKSNALIKLYKFCKDCGNFEFNNELVKKYTGKKFSNHFDATKLDNKGKLPKYFIDNNIALIHIGSGRHKFIIGIDNVYHDFEPIQEIFEWNYKKSLLNEYNTSESNILSVANNQRILHKFLLDEDKEFLNEEIINRPKTYFPHRTKLSMKYKIRGIEVSLTNMQVEIDLTIEYKGHIGIFEAKNGKPDNFSIYQIYHPYYYYSKIKDKEEMKNKIQDITCIYVVKSKVDNITNLKLWAYKFEDPLDMTSIKFIKSACYRLILPKSKGIA